MRIIGSSASAHVGIEFGIKGPTFATCSACSTATHAIGLARDYIKNGVVDVAICGASESVINYGTMKAWQALHVLSPQGCFPFAKKRNGTVLGEGAGILILEEYEHAKRRGATILAELAGYGMASDSQDMVKPTVEGPSYAMQMALDDAGIEASASRLPERPRHGDEGQRHQRDEGHQAGLQERGLEGRDLVDQVDDRTSARRRRRHRGRRMHQGHAGKLGSADHRPRRSRSECDLDYVPNVGRSYEGQLRDVELVLRSVA